MNLKRIIPVATKLVGVKLLTKEETIKSLMGSELFYRSGETLVIEPAKTWGVAPVDYTSTQIAEYGEIGVFKIPGSEKVKILNYGGVRINNEVLNLDFGSSLFIKSLVQWDRRPNIEVENCIVLWSHYWGNGYFDFMFFVFAKFLRIASALSSKQLSTVKIAYPLVNTSFEKDLWEIVGVKEEQIIDTRKFNIKAQNYYVANTQRSWWFQHKTDIKLAQQIIKKINIERKPEYRFVYISRKGRRQLTNENELRGILEELGFNFIEDKPRSITEQMTIFNNAEIIIGPHGAAFANLLWCKPGTQLIELFPRVYYPSYFRSLAQSLEVKYGAIFEDDLLLTHFKNLKADLTIDPQIIKTVLKERIAACNI
jgi:hypothetical protein